MLGLDDEIDRIGEVLLAAEDWAAGYGKVPDNHAKLIRADIKLERTLRIYYRELSKQTNNFINWSAYSGAVRAYNINVVVDDDAIDDTSGQLIKLTFDQITLMTALGAQAGETIYGYPLGLDTSSAIIQQVARDQVAKLVGMSFKNGMFVKNSNPDYSITETLRQDIRSSVQSSIALGENINDATDRLSSVIANPKRAEVIARTETVNSYSQGLMQFGKESNAVGKEWQDTGATDECADNSAEGIIGIDDDFDSGDSEPAAHPNCRCTIRLVYQNEMDDN